MNVSRKTILAVGGMIGLFVLGVGFLAWPAYRETYRLRHETQRLLEKSEHLKRDTCAMKQLAERVEELRARVQRDLKQVPSEPRVAEIMRRLSLPVDGVTVRDQTFAAGSPKPATEDEDVSFRAVPLTIELDATFGAIFSLLRATEQSPQLVRVKSVRIERHNEDSQKQIESNWLRASIGLEAVHEPEESTASGEEESSADLAGADARSTS